MAGLAIAQTAIAGIKPGTGIINFVKRKHGYVKDMTKNYAELMKEYEKLCAREKDAKDKLERYETDADETEECKIWRRKVGEMKVKVEALKAKYEIRPSGYIHYYNLMKLGGRIVKQKGEVVSLTNERNEIQNITIKKAPAPHISNPTNKITKFPSVEENVNKLQEYLRNKDIKTVGVWGPIGVGKSTLMDRLQQEIEKSNDFDFVFSIKVSSERDKTYIQQELLKRLKVNPEELSDVEKKNMIHEKLKNYQQYLLLLDDVFSNIELEDVGINIDEHRGKVVITSRYRQVFTQMNEVIEVKRLSDTDAQNMFWDRVGMDLKNNRRIKTHAELIIKFCSGMPYLINLIGNYLRMMSAAEKENLEAIWRNTWDELTSPTGKPKEDLETVYKSLKLEIDSLKGNDKSCFLYLASFPSRQELLHDYIIECWRAEQFLMDFEKLGMARDRGCSLLVYFVNHFLLEKGMKESQYKMFEFYQQLAPRIAINDNNYIEVPRFLTIDDSEKPISGRISTLLLQEISCFPQFGPFFEFLRHLELYKARIETLPPSISSLRNLKAMILKNCDQLTVLCDEIGDLDNLEILDIRHTGIYNLPLVVGNLTTLKCLRVSIRNNVENQNPVNGQAREMIAPNVLQRLHPLEELGIDVNPTDGRWDQIVESIVAEVAALTELTTLWFYFPTVNSFETFIRTSTSWNLNHGWSPVRLRSFNIIVGQQQENSLFEFDGFRWSAEKRLRFSGGETFPDAILKILKEASSFELNAHTAENLSVFSADDLGVLEVCTIKDCPEMTSIIDGNGLVPRFNP